MINYLCSLWMLSQTGLRHSQEEKDEDDNILAERKIAKASFRTPKILFTLTLHLLPQ